MFTLTEGEKGGKEGMESYIRDKYFPVVKADGSNTRWKADGDFAVRKSASCIFRLRALSIMETRHSITRVQSSSHVVSHGRRPDIEVPTKMLVDIPCFL